jgi:plasmid stability protein
MRRLPAFVTGNFRDRGRGVSVRNDTRSRTENPLRRHGDIIDIETMGQLIVRDLDDDVIRALKVRAAAKGRSAEAEHRELLREALAPRPKVKTLKDLLLEMPDAGDDADFERPRDLGRQMKW